MMEPAAYLRKCRYTPIFGDEYEGVTQCSSDDTRGFAVVRLSDAEARIKELEAALSKINDIRNSIIGCQNINWSEHIYPLVAALDEAGVEGQGYPEAREYVGTLIERTNAAEARAEAAEALLKEAGKALEPFAQEAARYEPDEGDGDDSAWAIPAYFKIRHLRAARAIHDKIGGGE